MIIYHIIINDEIAYVGKTENLDRRTRQHKWLLVHGKHQNTYLQEKYNQYKSFELVPVIENATDRDEQKEIIKHKTEQRSNRAMPTIEELRVIHRKTFS